MKRFHVKSYELQTANVSMFELKIEADTVDIFDNFINFLDEEENVIAIFDLTKVYFYEIK